MNRIMNYNNIVNTILTIVFKFVLFYVITLSPKKKKISAIFKMKKKVKRKNSSNMYAK